MDVERGSSRTGRSGRNEPAGSPALGLPLTLLSLSLGLSLSNELSLVLLSLQSL